MNKHEKRVLIAVWLAPYPFWGLFIWATGNPLPAFMVTLLPATMWFFYWPLRMGLWGGNDW